MIFENKRTPDAGVSNFVGFLLNLSFIFLLFIVLYFSFRFIGFWGIKKALLVSIWSDSVVSAFVMGFRYDAKVVAILMLPMILAGLPLLWFTKNYRKWLNRVVVVYIGMLGVLILFVEVVNIHYFQFFKLQINVDVFGIFYDDTEALIHSIVADFPVIPIIGAFIGAVVGLYYLTWYLVTRSFHPGKRTSYLIILLFLLLLLVGARGSMGTFPLQKCDRTVSANPLVNELVMNGLYALLEAQKEFNKGRYYTDVDEILHSQGYEGLEEAISQYGFGVGGTTLDSLFVYQSAKKPEGFKNPNVVVIFMEGMGTCYFWPDEFLTENLGVLGAQLPDYDVFYKCLPGGNLTVSSIESFILGTIDGPLCQSKYAKKAFSSSIALPFAQAGYDNLFITGGKLDWRNMGSFLSTQGFQESVGMEVISEWNKGAMSNEWGVYDEYLFDYLHHRLAMPGDPKFVFALTTSNHIPYDIPPGHTPQNLSSLPFKKAVGADTTTINKNLELFYYAANQLGLFMDKLRHSELGEHTIVVVTGDHSIRHHMTFSKEQLHKNYAVPLIFYVPDAYKKQVPVVDRWVSHRDINNTLFELALSDAAYQGMGSDLFGEVPSGYYGVNDKCMAVSDRGVSELKEGNMYKWGVNDWNGELYSMQNDSALLIQQSSLKAFVTLLRIKQAWSLGHDINE
ncbi:MAG: sulfatase-like hydrolase/transferase [Bacteroidales bacterium]|nr:sulfatase-like hydrolase/transferase [Bacteroidales bacterium]